MAHAGGRPPKYKTPEEMAGRIDAYFDRCAGEYLTDAEGRYIMDRSGRPILAGATPPTVTGLALALGFATRMSLTMYQGKAAFRDLITVAKSRVEMYAEERLFDRDGCEGAKFTLRCNFGWGREEAQQHEERIIRIVEKSAGAI